MSAANLWAVTMVKDEADVIETTLRHIAAQGVTGIIVADNQSTDGTTEILKRMHTVLDCDLVYWPDDTIGYYQARKMTLLANEAHRMGAEWILPFDADEIWQHDARVPIAKLLAGVTAGWVEVPLTNHYVTGVDPETGSPFERMGYRWGERQPIPKVLIRWEDGCEIHQGNHGVTYPYPQQPLVIMGLEIRHFPYRSEAQFVSKAVNGSRAYAATDLDWGVGQHWREYGLLHERGGDQALIDAFRAHFVYDLPSAAGMVYDPAGVVA